MREKDERISGECKRREEMKVEDEITIEKIENLTIETSLEETLEFF